MRLMVLSVIGLVAGLGLAVAIVALPVMAEKGPLRTTLVAHLGGAQEEQVVGGSNPDGRGRAVVKVFKEQLCGRVETGAIESSSLKATINLGMSGENGPTVANLEERAAKTPLAESTAPTTTTTTGTTTPATGTITSTTGTTTPITGTTTSTTGATGAQQTGTTTGGTTSSQATTTQQSTTVGQTSLSQSTASPTASASASASAASASAASTSTAST